MGDGLIAKRLSDFEWASAAQYIVYITGVAGLKEFDISRATSLGICRFGTTKARVRKLAVLGIVKENLRCLVVFVERKREELNQNEMVIIRGMYRQHKECEVTIIRHLEVIRKCESSEQAILTMEGMVDEDGQLF